jgi:riboflavin kinase/FMN adenylyltransferase
MNGLIFELENIPQNEGFVITQGTFDGVHLGHQHVLKQVVNIAKEYKKPSLLITFYPHPRLVINPNDSTIKMLSSIEEKAKIILEMGIDYVLVLSFTHEISQYTPEKFVHDILVSKLNVKCMVVGYDHRFGKNRSGGFSELTEFAKKFNFKVKEINASEIDEIAVSSTRIRKAIASGNLKEANELLGKPYRLTGIVVEGQKLGRQLGFPTANLMIDEPHKLIPPNGVYLGFAIIQNTKYKIMLNIGVRPTVDGKNQTIEAHIIDFNENIYNQKLTIYLVQFLREELRFNGLEALKIQLQKDESITRSAQLF